MGLSEVTLPEPQVGLEEAFKTVGDVESTAECVQSPFFAPGS